MTSLRAATVVSHCHEMADYTEQRCAIKFMQKEGEVAANVFLRLRNVYGATCMSRARVFLWFKRFKDGRNSIDNDTRCGRPPTAVNDSNVSAVDKIIRADRRVRKQDIMLALQIGSHAVDEIIHDHLGFKKVCARWIPRQLTSDLKENRMDVCQDLFQQYDSEGDDFLRRIVTGDETWIHQFEPENKRESMQWRHVKSPPPRKFKIVPSTKKVMATIFWDSTGVLLVDFLPQGQSINADRYIATLQKLKRAVKRKRPGLNNKDILLQHDNARPHTALRTQQVIQKIGWTRLPHPPYSPDLAPSDYHLFGAMKKSLRGTQYSSVEDVQRAVDAWIRKTPTRFFTEGIFNLVPRWQKCIAGDGDYVEK